MPPKLKPSAALPPKKVKSPQKEPGVAKMQLKVATPPPAKKFSLKIDDAYMVKAYMQKNVDFVVAGPLWESHGYKADLSPDGTCLIWRRSILDNFFESKQTVSMLGQAYHEDGSHVIAHNDVIQQIQEGRTENNGLHFAPKRRP